MKFEKNDTKKMKAIAIFLMLYHHLFAFPERINYDYISLFKYHDKTLSYFIGDFGKICVGIFLFLGGYGTYIVYKNSTKGLLKNKLLSLYKSYWKVLFIVVLISLLLKDEKIQITFLSLIENISGWNPSYNGEWWFIMSYIILLLLSPLFIKVINKYFKKAIPSIITLIIFNTVLTELYPKVLNLPLFDNIKYTITFNNLNTTLFLIPIFISGMLFSKFKLLDKIKTIFTKRKIYTGFSILILILIFISRRILWRHSIDYILTPIFIGCLTIILSNKNKLFDLLNNILVKVGNESTNIWLVHSFFCYHWCQEFIFSPKLAILIFILLLVVSYIFSLLINKFYKYLSIIINKKEIIKGNV